MPRVWPLKTHPKLYAADNGYDTVEERAASSACSRSEASAGSTDVFMRLEGLLEGLFEGEELLDGEALVRRVLREVGKKPSQD